MSESVELRSDQLRELCRLLKDQIVYEIQNTSCRDDRTIAAMVTMFIDFAIKRDLYLGTLPINEEKGVLEIARASKAAEILEVIPEIPLWDEKRYGSNWSEGLPITRTVIWKALAIASARGTEHDSMYAKLLLKKSRLSNSEEKALRECLRDVFTNESSLKESRLLTNLQYIMASSEPIVIRALLHAAASRTDDGSLIDHIGALLIK